VGYSVAGYETALLGTMLESAGVSLTDVKLVNVNFALTEPLLGDQVDAVVGAYRNVEFYEMQLAGHPARLDGVEGGPPCRMSGLKMRQSCAKSRAGSATATSGSRSPSPRPWRAARPAPKRVRDIASKPLDFRRTGSIAVAVLTRRRRRDPPPQTA